jgi:outer membrane protein TolC
MVFPLLRDREIDRRRAGVQQATLDREAAEPNIQLQRIDAARAASRAYWLWVAAGQRYLIAHEVLEIAKRRDEQLGQRVRIGTLAPIEQTDNQRLIVDREARLVAATRAYQQTAILLSLYLRGPDGAPRLPKGDELPALTEPPPPPDLAQRKADLEAALAQRPELRRIDLLRQRAQVELRLAENQILPGLAAVVNGAQDVGAGKKDLDRYTYEAALLLDVPLQRRDARGKATSARGVIAQLNAQEQLARDRVVTEVQDALSGLELAYDLRNRTRENLRLALAMERAEYTQFEIGKSDLFRVNIRELQRAEAQFLEIDALSEYYRAAADYLAALGIDPSLAIRMKAVKEPAPPPPVALPDP